MVAGLILLSSIGALFWASEEWEFVRLFEGDQHVCRRSQPRVPAIAGCLSREQTGNRLVPVGLRQMDVDAGGTR